MAKKQQVAGSIYQRNKRWYWRVKVPGQNKFTVFPLKAPGAKYAYKGDKAVAIEIAKNMWQKFIFDSTSQNNSDFDGTIAELVKKYISYADETYRRVDGSPTRYPQEIREAMKPLVLYCGSLPVEEFGPRKLKEYRKYLAGFKRKVKGVEINRFCLYTLNKKIKAIKTMFKWAASEEYVHGSIYYALQAVRSLTVGQIDLVDNPPVEPVEKEHMEAVLPYTTSVLADMMRLQFLTGMRSIELTGIQPYSIKKDGDVWWYHVPQIYNKNARHGVKHERVVPIGPKAQKILAKYLLRNSECYCFTPQESQKQRLETAHKNRKTPLSCGNKPGTNRKFNPARSPGEKWDSAGYCKAVKRAVKAAQKDGVDVPMWTPHQLRHSAATIIASEFDLDTARAVLGHKSLQVTKIYAKEDMKKIIDKYKKIG